MPTPKKTTKKATGRPPAPDYIRPHLHDRIVPLSSLQRDPRNCKRHGDTDLTGIMASLRQLGQVKTIVADAKTRIIYAGNGTHEAAQRLGWEFIAVELVEFKSLEEARAYAFADNRTAQLSEWDQVELSNYLQDIETVSTELYDALLLDDLAIAKETPQNSLPSAVKVPEKFAVMANVPSEAAQKKLFQLLKDNGYTDVKLITT